MLRQPVLWGLLTLLAGACGGTDEGDGPDAVEPGGGKGDGVGGPAAAGELRRLELTYGAVPAVPGRPNVLAYLPSDLDTSDGVSVVVFLHGWYNCVENLARARNGACAPGRPARQAYDLSGQLERSGKNAILLLPQLAFDEAKSEAWAFAEPHQFLWMLWEAMGAVDLSLWDVRRVVVVSHSGGYRAAAAILDVGGVWVDEVWLLDSLYGEEERFTAWLDEDPEALPTLARRFVNLYTAAGGTMAGSVAFAEALAPRFDVVDDRAPGPVGTELGGNGVLFKRSHLAHDPLVRQAFGELLSTSGIPDR